MAITFKNIKSPKLGLVDFFTFGKYQNCRVDSIVEMDYNYIMFLHNNNQNMFNTKVIDRCMLLKNVRDSEQHYQEEILPFEDVPF
jgi:hypothetical protein